MFKPPVGHIASDHMPMLPTHTSASGIGDTSLVYAVWPYANRETDVYWGVGAYLILPTGNYEAANASFNMGSDRYSYALQTGCQMPIGEHMQWTAAVDGLWFTDTPNFIYPNVKYKQSGLYTMQSGLNWDIDARYSVAATYFYTAGGLGTLNDQSMGNTTELQRYQLTLSSKWPFGKLVLQYGTDLTTKNGYFEDNRLILRYIKAF